MNILGKIEDIKHDIEIIDLNNQEDIYDELLFHNIIDKKQRKLHVSKIKEKYSDLSDDQIVDEVLSYVKANL